MPPQLLRTYPFNRVFLLSHLYFRDNPISIERLRLRILYGTGMMAPRAARGGAQYAGWERPALFLNSKSFYMLNKSLIIALVSAGLFVFGAAQAQETAADSMAPAVIPAVVPEAPAAKPAKKVHQAAKKQHTKHTKHTKHAKHAKHAKKAATSSSGSASGSPE
jgi:hypothetical protein